MATYSEARNQLIGAGPISAACARARSATLCGAPEQTVTAVRSGPGGGGGRNDLGDSQDKVRRSPAS